MKTTTAQRFGSLGKSFVSPSAAAAVIGAALLASDTSDTSETAWSPAAACLLPDTLPAVGTLLSYGGSRQLAAGGTVTHSGALTIGGNLSIGANSLVSTYSGIHNAGKWLTGSDDYGSFYISPSNAAFAFAPPAAGTIVGSIDYQGRFNALLGFGVGSHDSANTTVRYYRNATGPKASIRAAGGLEIKDLAGSTDAALTCGAITASGTVTIDNGSSEGILNLTGTTGRTGYIKHNGTTVLQLTAYSSAVTSYKPIYVAHADGLRTDGPIQETPTQSALDPTTTNIPSGKRQGWYNSTLSEFRDWVNIGGTLLKSAAYT